MSLRTIPLRHRILRALRLMLRGHRQTRWFRTTTEYSGDRFRQWVDGHLVIDTGPEMEWRKSMARWTCGTKAPSPTTETE